MWSDLAAWAGSEAGIRLIDGAVVPAIAILVAALLAAWIARRALVATATRLDRAAVTDALAGAIASVEAASASRGQPDRPARADTDLRLRLLPLPGAALAADWIGSAIAGLEHGAPDAPTTGDARDRLLAWAAHPRRATTLFGAPRRPARPADTLAASTTPVAPSAEPQPAPTTPAAAAPDLAAAAVPPVPPAPAAAPAAEPESGPLTEPVVVRRQPDPALLAAVERELAATEAHARHARPVEQPFVPAEPAQQPEPSRTAERATHHAAHSAPAHRDPAVWADGGEDDDTAEVVADAREDAPDPVLVTSLSDRRFSADSLVPDGAVPVTRAGHRPSR